VKKQYSNTVIDYSLKELDSHITWKEKQVVKKRILTDIGNTRYAEMKFTNKGNFKKRMAYSGIVATLLISIFSGTVYYSPVLAEVISKVPFLSGLDNNRVKLQKHPDEVGAYLNLVSAFNKGNKKAYLQSYSNKLSSHSLKSLEEDFDIGVKEEHLFSSRLDLIYSSEKTAILLSEESHSFNEEVKYSLNEYVILNKENGEWKVLNKLPFKKTGRGNYGSSNNFDNTEEVINNIEQTYDIRLGRVDWK
jgi:hypothetical protein